jgi:hypothetical protein
MKKQFKLAAVAVILAVTATTALAADFVGATIANDVTDVATFETLAIEEMAVGYGLSSAAENVALVAQSGDANIAYVNQTGVANFTAIVQNAVSSNVAYAIQTGDTNRAVIIQH